MNDKRAKTGIPVAISEAARRCGLTIRAVRFYEEQGLIEPIRAANGSRCFDDAGIARLNFVAAARRAGIAVRDIRSLLHLRERHGHAAEAVQLRAICESLLKDVDRRRQHLQEIISVVSMSARKIA